MLDGACIAVVVPAHDEEHFIHRVLDTIPAYVDFIFVVDDASSDHTFRVAQQHGDARVHILRHAFNRGVGASIATGYRLALQANAHVVAVMAGDGQMDPDDLLAVLRPVVDGKADYVKGTRLSHEEAYRMPALRRLGTRVFGWATSQVVGYPLTDSQCGYTAISSNAIRKLDLHGLWPSFGYPNDLLFQLRMHDLRVAEVSVRPVYDKERSELKPRHAFVIACLIARGAWRIRLRSPSIIRRREPISHRHGEASAPNRNSE